MKGGGPARHTDQFYTGKLLQQPFTPLLLAFNSEIAEGFGLVNQLLWRLLLLPDSLSVSGIKVTAWPLASP